MVVATRQWSSYMAKENTVKLEVKLIEHLWQSETLEVLITTDWTILPSLQLYVPLKMFANVSFSLIYLSLFDNWRLLITVINNSYFKILFVTHSLMYCTLPNYRQQINYKIFTLFGSLSL